MSQVGQILEREGIKIASSQKRIIAFGIDEMIVSVLFFVAFFNDFALIANQGLNQDEIYNQITALVSSLVLHLLAIRLIYQTFFIWYMGATIGKTLVKITCIDTDYFDKPNFITSLNRALIRNVSELAFYLGFLWAFGNDLRQTWHDKFSKVVVIDVA